MGVMIKESKKDKAFLLLTKFSRVLGMEQLTLVYSCVGRADGEFLHLVTTAPSTLLSSNFFN